jgi:cell fate regulator YaaT (PSP1 superfamily)
VVDNWTTREQANWFFFVDSHRESELFRKNLNNLSINNKNKVKFRKIDAKLT